MLLPDDTQATTDVRCSARQTTGNPSALSTWRAELALFVRLLDASRLRKGRRALGVISLDGKAATFIVTGGVLIAEGVWAEVTIADRPSPRAVRRAIVLELHRHIDIYGLRLQLRTKSVFIFDLADLALVYMSVTLGPDGLIVI